jgi:hypothetical protein
MLCFRQAGDRHTNRFDTQRDNRPSLGRDGGSGQQLALPASLVYQTLWTQTKCKFGNAYHLNDESKGQRQQLRLDGQHPAATYGFVLGPR